MADYRYLLVDASSGVNQCELPLAVQSFSRVINGCGTLSATLPLDWALPSGVSLIGDREITVLRDGAPVWNGPITAPLTASFSTRVIELTAREASWYLGKRTLEINKDYNADLFYIVRNLFTYMTTKTSNGTTGGTGINATLPRFVASAPGASGTTKAVRYYGAARHTIADIYNDLVADPTTGLDYRMDYSSGSTRQQCVRTLTFGSPSLGTTRAQRITEHLVTDFTLTLDRERAASRVHVLGAGYTSTAQNTGSVAAGDILIEAVTDRTDKSNHTFLDNYARDFRFRAQPPVTTYAVSFTPGAALTWGWAELGDKVPIAIGGSTMLATSGGNARVIEVSVTPSAGDAQEVVTLTLATPLDQLGT